MTPGQIGRYQILSLLGQGSMSTVYQARDPVIDRNVVVKVVTISSPSGSDEWRQRFKREVQAAGRLNHPHIVTVYDVNLDHDPPYVVMELLGGGTLRDSLQHGPLPWRKALTLFQPLVQALAYAHHTGIIHRDLKPGNIMFATEHNAVDTLKLVDFGLARQQDDSLQLTKAGAVFGTPAYLSPEQARGDRVDARTDIFSMGIILFECITGYNPLNKGSLYATLAETTSSRPIDLSTLANKAPLSVMHLIERAIAKDRERRYATCEAFLADLTYCLGDSSPSEATKTDSGVATTQFSAQMFLHSGGPVISKAQKIDMPPEVEAVLKVMFNQYSRLAVESEFGQGLSGGRVFRVRPVEAGGKAHLPAVVKIAPVNLIRQEWQAYQTWVVNTLPGVARLESTPTLPPGSLWDGLRYTLVGGGAFEVQSLAGYYYQASANDLQWILTDRLYQMIGVHWWLERNLDRAFQMEVDYDSILPVNLLIKPVDPASVTGAYPITPEQLPALSLMEEDVVRLTGFIVTEIDAVQRHVTLNLPASAQGRPAASYRLRLVEVTNIGHYQIGQVVDSLTGVVTATRHDLLLASVAKILDPKLDLSAERLTSPEAQDSDSPLLLPNPLLAYQDVLRDFMTVYISTIHGDLNLENILIDPDTRHFNLIDFATVRQGHALHDLLRLEAEVITKLLPPALVKANLPPTTIHYLYRQLDIMARGSSVEAEFAEMHPALQKAMTMLIAIRKMARSCLFNPEDWTEYYRGLIIYQLGVLKFKNLDDADFAPLPKRVAFWGAASLVELLHKPPPAMPQPKQMRVIRLPLLIVAILEALIIVGMVLFMGTVIFDTQPSNIRQSLNFLIASPQEEPLATMISLSSGVKIERDKTNRILHADLGQPLYRGDHLLTEGGASVYLLCEDGSILTVLEWRNIPVDCRQRQGVATLVDKLDSDLSRKLVSLASKDVEFSAEPLTTRQEALQTPLLLTPRNSVVINPRPAFRWQPVEGASGYRLVVTLADGQTWQQDTTSTVLRYPANEPPLESADDNIINLMVLGDTVHTDRVLVETLTDSEKNNLLQIENSIRNLDLDETTQEFILAQFYREQQIWADAENTLKELIQIQTPPSPNLLQQLGDIYFEIGLYTQAEKQYQQAFDTATTESNPGAQATAKLGLARVLFVFNETQAAFEALNEAEALYREAGQVDIANTIAQEQAKLQQ